MSQLFSPGAIFSTPGALKAMEVEKVNASMMLTRHISGDFGDLCKQDWQMNVDAIKQQERVFSSYVYGETKFWVITEASREYTTILLPEEY